MHSLFNNCSIDLSKLTIKEFQKGAIIHQEGDKCHCLNLVIEGKISISTLTYFDNEYEIIEIGKNGLFGENLLFTDDYYLGDVICIENTKLIQISKNELLDLFKNQKILENYLLILSNKSKTAMNKLKILSQKTIRDKIMFYIINNIKSSNNKTIKISSKESLANYLNIPRPSLSRELIALKNEKIIDYDKHTITYLRW